MICYLYVLNLSGQLRVADGFSSVDYPAPTSRSLQNDILLKWDTWIILKILAISTVKRHSNICDVWMESGRKVIMSDFCEHADGSWSCLADGTIAFLYVWNFGSYGISSFCFPCACFLSTKRMMPIKTKQGDKGRKHLHSSRQLSHNAASQKYKERDQEYRRGKKKKPSTNWTAGNWRMAILREKPFHMLLAKCQAFSQIRFCKEGNVWKFSLWNPE